MLSQSRTSAIEILIKKGLPFIESPRQSDEFVHLLLSFRPLTLKLARRPLGLGRLESCSR